jgi:hypothetical protein
MILKDANTPSRLHATKLEWEYIGWWFNGVKKKIMYDIVSSFRLNEDFPQA